MGQYYFNIDGRSRETDHTGLNLPGLHQVRCAAIAYAGALLKDEPDLVWDDQEFKVDVTDQGGNGVLAVYVRAVDTIS
jgi:hypothetical protein